MHVRDDPLIFSGCAVQRKKAKPSRPKFPSTKQKSEATEQKGALLIREIWQNGTNSVHHMSIVNTEARSYLTKTLEKCLQEAERATKNIYLEACLHQLCHLLPFFASADGLLGVETGESLKILSSRPATKQQQTYSRKCGYIKHKIAITLVRATHQCIRGSRVPANKIIV